MKLGAGIRRLIQALARTTRPDPNRSGGFPLWWPSANTAGERVTHDNAMQLSAVYACVRVIAETIAMLPWHVFEDIPGSGKIRRATLRQDEMLYRRPNPETSSFAWRETTIAHALTWGNGYSEIERDNAGRPVALWQITPDRVTPERNEQGRLVWRVNNDGGPQVWIDDVDMFHLHGLGYDGAVGYSVITLAAQAIGSGMATDKFAGSFFGNGAHAGQVLTHPAQLSKPAQDRLKDEIEKRLRSAANANRPLILEEGMKWEQLGVPPDDAQFLQTREFQVRDICRWYRVPPHKVADLANATFSNIEHQAIEFVSDTLQPWVTRLEQEANKKLLGRQQRSALYTKINMNALLRGDAKSRAEYYNLMRNMGVFSVNDIRELEDMNPIGPDGDKRIAPMNMTTLERIGEEPEEPEPDADDILQASDNNPVDDETTANIH